MPGLLYYMHDGLTTFRFELSGNLGDEDVAHLEHAWKTALSAMKDKTLIIDLSFVNGMDDAGRRLLLRWNAYGAHFVAQSETSRKLIEAVIGRALPLPVYTREPYRIWPSWRNVALLVIAILALAAAAACSPATFAKSPEREMKKRAARRTASRVRQLTMNFRQNVGIPAAAHPPKRVSV